MKLIINADDYGRTKGINYGIIEAHKNGVLTSTTIMINLPHVEHGITLLKDAPNLGVGLHITLDAGKPISNSLEKLVNEEGNFKHRENLMNVSEEEIEKEVRAQYDKALSLGIDITHFDSHHHIHLIYPNVTNVVKKLAKEYGIPIRWARTKETLEELVKSFKKDITDFGETPSSTEDLILDFYDDKVNFEELVKMIEKVKEKESIEMMCHPAFLCSETYNSSYNEPRIRELDILTSEKLKNLVKDLNIKLITYREL